MLCREEQLDAIVANRREARRRACIDFMPSRVAPSVLIRAGRPSFSGQCLLPWFHKCVTAGFA